MNYWPTGMKVDPIGQWPGALTPQRQRSPFSAKLSSTMAVLQRELRELGAKNARMQIAVPANQFRLDGYPRATAKPEHPGIILTLDSRHGPLSYPCDTFTTWQDNLRAIALALEALRKVDRYGVTKRGEQYRGFLALEATSSSGFTTVSAAAMYVGQLAGIALTEGNPDGARRALRLAKRAAHPDTGGTPTAWARLAEAEKALRTAGWI